MLTLNDGRSELWQWDTGRKLTVDADCSQVHFSNKVFGRSVDVDVVGGVASIPDILLQTDKDLIAWAFFGTAENGYTKISKVFKVNRRNKPADYVFTPPEQTALGEILERLDKIEESQDPDAIKNAVDDYLANNQIQIKEEDPTVPNWAKQPTKPTYTAKEVGAVATINGVSPDDNGNVEITIPDSGGDSSAFYIAISEENGSYVMDKTFPELKEAHEAGRPVYAIVNVTVENSRVNNAIFQFSNVFDAFFVFTYFGNDMLFTAYVTQNGISFRVKRYAEESSIPDKLPNPNVLTFKGAVSGTYDGSSAVTIDIPVSGGNVDQSAPFEYQEPSANLFDKDSVISGYYYDIDGTLKALAGYGSSGLVKCSPNTTYTKYLFGGKVTFYDSARGFIGGENNDTNYITTPDGCRYFRVSFSLANIDRCMILEGRIENPSALEYVVYNKGYIKSDLLTVLQENLSEDLIAWMVHKFGSPKIRVNPTEPLNITTYAGGNNQPTHPKALYFPNGWNGHKYWMVYTPYPGNNNQQENPCITYSDDGFDWSENGISNPIATAPSGGYNSDTHIVVVNGTMECWWREVVSNEEIIVRKKSTDGITWGEREELFRTGTYTANDCVSPSVIYDEGKYKIWAVYHRNCLKYYESADGTNWQYVRDIDVNPPGSSYKIWHFDIIKTSKGYEFVGCYQLNGSFDKNNFIYYSTSQNNIGYKYPVRILTNGYDGRFDRLELYRPCLLKMNDGTDHEYYNLYYGAQGAKTKWAIGLVQASDIESLKCYIEQEALYVDGYLEADTETEEPDVPDIPDEPDDPEVTLTSISATYSGGDVVVGTAVTVLSGIVVTAHYSDGSTGIVTGYTLSGNIAEGSNTITVSYGGKTTTFTVTGIAESGEPKEIVINNLVDHSAIDKGGFFDSATGKFNEDASYNSSGFIPVNPGDNIEFDGASAAYFDANKNYVSGIPYSATTPKTATVPDGVAYISFAFRQNGSVGYLLVLPIKEADIAIGEDVATSDNIDLTGFYADGVFKTDSTYGTLKMTNVSPGMVFAATNANTASFYDKNKTYVGQKSSSNITVPKTAVYMAVSFNKSKTLSVVRTT